MLNIVHDKLLESADKVLGLIAKVSIVLGFVIMASYLLLNGAYPDNMGLGDGILFMLIAAVFGGAYLIYVSSLVAVGSLPFVTRDIIVVLYRICFKKRFKLRLIGVYAQKLFATFQLGIGLALIGLIVLFDHTYKAISTQDYKLLIGAIFIPLFGAFVWRQCEAMGRKIRRLELRPQETEEYFSEVAKTKVNRLLSLLLLLALPIALNFGIITLLNSTMQTVNLREPHVSLHIKQPYVTYMTQYSYTGNASAFGESFRRYDGFTVILKGIGDQVFIRSEDGKGAVVSIPRSYIYIVPDQEQQS